MKILQFAQANEEIAQLKEQLNDLEYHSELQDGDGFLVAKHIIRPPAFQGPQRQITG